MTALQFSLHCATLFPANSLERTVFTWKILPPPAKNRLTRKQRSNLTFLAGCALLICFIVGLVDLYLYWDEAHRVYPGSIGGACMYEGCGEIGGRSLFASLRGGAARRLKTSDNYALESGEQTYTKTSTGYVPHRDTYLEVQDDGRIKVEKETNWEQVVSSSDYSDFEAHITGNYCDEHIDAAMSLIKGEIFKAYILRNPIAMLGLVGFPALIVALIVRSKVQKRRKAKAAAAG